MKTAISTILLVILFTIASSCSFVRINYYGSKIKKVKKIALVTTMLGPLYKSPLPLIDAAYLNYQTNQISQEINQAFKERIDLCRDQVARSLAQKFNCEVIYGEAINNTIEFEEIKSKYNYPEGLKADDTYFPEILLATGDFSPFKFIEGDVVSYFYRTTDTAYFNSTCDYITPVWEFGHKFDADMIAVSFSSIGIRPGGAYKQDQIGMGTYLYLFSRDGELLAIAFNGSKPATLLASNPKFYSNILVRLPTILREIMNKMDTGNFIENE